MLSPNKYGAGDSITAQLVAEPGEDQTISHASVFLVNSEQNAGADPNRPNVIILESAAGSVADPTGTVTDPVPTPVMHPAGTALDPVVDPVMHPAGTAYFPTGTVVLRPTGTVALSQLQLAGTVPGGIVGGRYVAAYAIFVVGGSEITVIDIDPDGNYSADIADDPTLHAGPPHVRGIQ